MSDYIIDVNVDCNPENKNYPSYFFDDLYVGKRIRAVVGGSHYRRELVKKAALRQVINQLASAGRVRVASDAKVDAHQNLLEVAVLKCSERVPSQCDDFHIFALAHVSGCTNVITNDRRIAVCRSKIRAAVGHGLCPAVRVITNKVSYIRTGS